MKISGRRITVLPSARKLTAAILAALICALILMPCAASAAAENGESGSSDPELDIIATLESDAATPGALPEATESALTAPAAESGTAAPTPEAEKKGNGRFFVTWVHIIISCVVSLGIAILIAVLQARKRFK